MAFTNQGSRPNYPSTQDQLNYQPPAYDPSNHTIWTGGAVRNLSKINETVDFDWPRIFVRGYLACCVRATDFFAQYYKLSRQDKDNLVSNIAGHLGAVNSDQIKKRQLDVFAKVAADFASAIAKGMNYSYTPPS
jgi:catalase